MVYYCNPYINLVHTQQMDYQVNSSNDQITSSCSSSSPENIYQNGKLCSKIVDNQDANNLIPFRQQQRENTIEEFLVKAGGIHPRSSMAVDPTAQQSDWSKLQMMHQQQLSVETPIYNDVVDSGFRICENNNDFTIMSSLVVPMVERKVICSSFKEKMTEKAVERRRKRMIKNRESAARSRARKQAHTNQLELEVMELRKTNNRLKKQMEASKYLSKHSTSETRYQLRRTSSTSF